MAELIPALLLTAMAALIMTAYIVDAVGRRIDPLLMLLWLLLEVATVAAVAYRGRWWRGVRLEPRPLVGFAVVVAGLFAYVLWLARPSYLPVTQGVDIVHHLSLIDFISRGGALPHDRSLHVYLGEFVEYPAGSHTIAVLVAAWLGTTSVQVVHPLLALLVAVKAGIVHNLILRLVPSTRRDPPLALAGTALLLLPWGYFLGSFVEQYFFYAQVVSETFAVAMLWALVVWHARPSNGLLAFFALCGIAVWLSWSVWVSIPLLALVGLLLLRPGLSLRDRIVGFACGVGPTAVIALAYTAGRLRPAGIITAGGGVLQASIDAYGWPFVGLAILGIVVSWRKRRALPVLLFGAAAAAQAAALFAVDAYAREATYYQGYKQFYLLLYPLTLFAALGLDALRRTGSRWWSVSSGAWWPGVGLLLVVLVMAIGRDLPSEPRSVIREPVYQAGLWAQAHLPNDRVDYFVDTWTTAYWLHIHMLGNPRVSPRTEAVFYGGGWAARRASRTQWTNPEGLPFAIVGDLGAVPPSVRPNLAILYQSGPAAVVRWTNVAAAHP